MISRYDVTPLSSQTDSAGNFYPDVMQFSMSNIPKTLEPKQYIMRAKDIDRFDITVAIEYGDAMYDDLVLLYNGIGNIHDVTPGQILFFPDKADLDSFIIKNRVL